MELANRAAKCAQKLLKEWSRVVRTRRCLRVVLYSKHWKLAVTKAFDGTIVQVHVSDFQITRSRHRLLVTGYRESVVLRGDEDMSGLDFLHRMVSTSVAIGHLHGRAAKGKT